VAQALPQLYGHPHGTLRPETAKKMESHEMFHDFLHGLFAVGVGGGTGFGVYYLIDAILKSILT